jgi:hypothetical protein
MQTLETSLSQRLAAGLIDAEQAVAASLHPGEIVGPKPS